LHIIKIKYYFSGSNLNLMRKILLSILLLIVCLAANGQNSADDDWTQGHYYDKSGKKIDGLVADYYLNPSLFNSTIDYFSFKTTKTGKNVKVYAKEINSLVVVGVDSFVVSNSSELKKPFLSVIANNNTKLYATEVSKYVNVPSVGLLIRVLDKKYLDCTYYYGPDPNNLTKLTKKNFVSAMDLVLADKPDQYALIKDKTFTYDNIEKMVTFFKTVQVSINDDNDDSQ